MVVMRGKRAVSPLGTAGDTIVEVLIAIAIVSLTLTSAYALTRRNTMASQQTQEQSTALKLVERQTELLLADAIAPTVLGCFNETGVYVVLPSVECSMNFNGLQYDEAVDGGAKYNLSINPTANGTYTVNAQWSTLSGPTADVSTYVRRAE